MENAVDALKMAFAMLVFVMALGSAISTLSLARETADIMLTVSDPPHFAGYIGEEVDTSYSSLDEKRVRIVGLETIIPTLYKYYKEDYMVVFQEKVGNEYQPMRIYTTQTNPELWSASYTKLWKDGEEGYNYLTDLKYDRKNIDGSYDIACFDVEAESARKEPWTGANDIGQTLIKKNLDCILEGKPFTYPDGSGRTYNYASQIRIRRINCKISRQEIL